MVGSGSAEAGIRLEWQKRDDLQHACLGDGQAGEGGANVGLRWGFPEDGGSGHVSALPDLAEEASGIKFLDSTALCRDQLRGEGVWWKSVGAAARESEELHREIVKGREWGKRP